MDPAAGAAGMTAEAGAAAAGRKVMVGMDDSDESFYSLNWVVDNLLKASGDPSQEGEKCLVYIVHVQEPFHSYVFPAGPAFFATSVLESVRRAQSELAESLSTRAMKLCKEKQVRSETLILEGSPREMLCQAAEQMHVDLLVIGSRGLGQVKRAFLGSVSDYCAHHAACPVLIVKPPKTSYHK